MILFFQAEDGIRDIGVTGVQTCALPISPRRERCVAHVAAAARKSRTKSRLETASIELGATPAKPSARATRPRSVAKLTPASAPRSEERRVGKQCRFRWSLYL